VPRFVQFQVYVVGNTNGGDCYINPEEIVQISAYSDRTGISKTDGKTVDVVGSVAEVIAKLQAA
jgi:uncharacterized protein YlzI (FlbEa/FlbD family)